MNRNEVVKKIREMQQIAERFELRIADHDHLLDEHNRLLDEHNRLVEEHNRLVTDYKALSEELLTVGIGRIRPDDNPWNLTPINEPCDRSELDPAVLAKYVNNLIVLRRLTDPQDEGNSTFTKTENADMAILLAAELFRTFAEWAIDHRIGLELLGPPDKGFKREPTTSAADPWTNDHRFELFGRLVRWDKLKTREAQLAAGTILETLEDLYPSGLSRRLRNGMAQVIIGSEATIFRPTRQRKGKGRDPSILWTLRLHAIGNVHYRLACGLKKMDAVRLVADKFGVAPGNIQTWENRAPSVVGQTAYRIFLKTAQILANERYHGIVYMDSRLNPTGRVRFERLFTDEQLTRYGEFYHRCSGGEDLTKEEIENIFPQS